MAKAKIPETVPEAVTHNYALTETQVIRVQDILRQFRRGLELSNAPAAVIADVVDLAVCFTWPTIENGGLRPDADPSAGA